MEDYQEFLYRIHGEIMDKKDLWESRYAGYISKIKAKSEKPDIKVPPPIYEYTTISNEMKGSMISILRYCGQEIASVALKNNDCILKISPTNDNNNTDYFNKPGVPVHAGEYGWGSDEKKKFINYFCKECAINEGKSREHTLESRVLSELEMKNSCDEKTGHKKSLTGIQPVEIHDRRFQMPTPIRASKHDDIHFAKVDAKGNFKGGGIDILARQGHGRGVNLNVIELKDEFNTSEPPKHVIKQAIAYAAFLRDLIRSEKANGKGWYELFGFKKSVDKPLCICCTAAMPDIKDMTIFRDVDQLTFGDETGDYLELHLMNVTVEGNDVNVEMI